MITTPTALRSFVRVIISACLVLMICGNSLAQTTWIKPQDKRLDYSGRVGFEQDKAAFYWPGTSVTIRFTGTATDAVMADKEGDNYFYVITDNNQSKPLKIRIDTAKQTYRLAAGLPYGQHTVELFKVTNSSSATSFYGFQLLDKASVLNAEKKPQRKIEFYGNSITAGHGVEVNIDSAQDSQSPLYFNNYLSYAAITARHYNAQYSCIARSGIGIMLSWFPEIMPEIYDRLDPTDSTNKWDFKKYTPDIVVINLFQNDYWLVNKPEHAQFKARFGTVKPDEEFIIKAYYNFLASIRGKYPNAYIICTLGSMNATEKGSKWPGYIMEAEKRMNDQKMKHHFYPFKNTPGHPKIKEQQEMAASLIQFIDENIKW